MSRHVVILPFAEQPNDKVASEFAGEDLREEVNVRDESSLEDDGDVRGVEQLDGIGLLEATHPLRRERQLNSEALEVNHNQHHNHSCE